MDPVPFRGLNEYGEVRLYDHGILPHWRQEGCTYFVTFRLADSVPQSVLQSWREDRLLWLANHGIDGARATWKKQFQRLPYKIRREYERTFAKKIDDWLDRGSGSCVLRRSEVQESVASALMFFHEKRVWTGDYVIMPNHVHVILRPSPGHELEETLHSIKGFTAHEINRLSGTRGRVWQRESYDHIIRDFEQLARFQHYIHANPGKAKLAKSDYAISKECCYVVE